MPYTNILAETFSQVMKDFYQDRVSTDMFSMWIDQLDYSAIVSITDQGDTLLSEIILAAQPSQQSIDKCLRMMNLLMRQARNVSINQPVNAAMFFLMHKNLHGCTAFHHALLSTSPKIINQFFHNLEIQTKATPTFSEKCRQLFFEVDFSGNSLLCFLLKYGKAENLAFFFCSIKKGIQAKWLIPSDRYEILTELYCPVQDQTPLFLALASKDTALQNCYLHELYLSASNYHVKPGSAVFWFIGEDENNLRLLDRLIRACVPLERCFAVIDRLRSMKLMSESCYHDLVMNHPRSGYSLYHELLMEQDLSNLITYNERVIGLKECGAISTDEFLDSFKKINKLGFPVIHQAVNNERQEMSWYILKRLKETISDLDFYQLITYKANGIIPKCNYNKHHANAINKYLALERASLRELLGFSTYSPGNRNSMFSPKTIRQENNSVYGSPKHCGIGCLSED